MDRGGITVTKGLNRLTLLMGSAMLLAATAAGSIIGGLGPIVPSASDLILTSSTATATAPATERPSPTSAALSDTPVAPPTPRPAPTQATVTPLNTPPTSAATPEPTQPPTTDAPAIIDYTVQSGDVLFGLAQRFNTTREAILALNPGINPESLIVGEVLRIPGPDTAD